jgi:outer membrane protein assembly factor BamA
MILLLALPISDIRVSGNKFFKTDFIRSAFGYKRVLFFFQSYPKYSPFLIKRGINFLEEVYRDSGFFDVSINWEAKFEGNSVKVFVYIKEGERYKISEIYAPEELGIKFKTRPYSSAFLFDLENQILSFYRNKGYPFVEVKREEIKDGESKTVKVSFEVSKGNRIRIREILLKSADNKPLLTRKKIFWREIVIKKGDYFSERGIEESITRLYRTQLFSYIYWKLEDVNDEIANLTFYFKEGPPRILDISGGLQSENKRPILLNLESLFQHLNLFNNLQRVQVSLGTSIDILRFSPTSYRFSLTYQEPYFLDLNLRASLSLPINYDVDRDIFQYGFSGQITKPYFLGKNGSTTFGYSYELRKSLTGGKNYELFKPYQNLILDYRDNIFDPNFGGLIKGEIQVSGLNMLGDYDFVKLNAEISIYQRFFLTDWKWALRLYIGSISPFGRSDTLPLLDLFTLGGEGSVRGYDRFSIGPLLRKCYSSICKAGKRPFVINYEIRRKINEIFGFVLLFDYGYLDGYKGYSAGLGLRYYTPVGPVRLDWALSLKDRSPTDRGKIYVSLGHMF